MARANAADLVRAVVDGVVQSGGAAHLLSAAGQNPRQILVQHPLGEFEVWVYLWTLTHGGRKSLRDEFRVQMTGVESPLARNPDGPTVLLGYEPERGMFAGFDIDKHEFFTAGSPSVQTDVGSLDAAVHTGLALHEKSNEEVAIGFRPDHLVGYVLHAPDLHRSGAAADLRALLVAAVNLEELPDEALDALSEDRKRVVVTTSRLARAGDFRVRVLSAYRNTCAVSRCQLGILDAAHILPVDAEGSTDGTGNGICLAPSIHRAFDRGLIYLDEDCTVRISEERVEALKADGIDAGLAQLKAMCDRQILMPIDEADRPDTAMIQRANQIRGVV